MNAKFVYYHLLVTMTLVFKFWLKIWKCENQIMPLPLHVIPSFANLKPGKQEHLCSYGSLLHNWEQPPLFSLQGWSTADNEQRNLNSKQKPKCYIPNIPLHWKFIAMLYTYMLLSVKNTLIHICYVQMSDWKWITASNEILMFRRCNLVDTYWNRTYEKSPKWLNFETALQYSASNRTSS